MKCVRSIEGDNHYQLSLINLRDGTVLQTGLDDHCDKLQRNSVQFHTLWASTFVDSTLRSLICRGEIFEDRSLGQISRGQYPYFLHTSEFP